MALNYALSVTGIAAATLIPAYMALYLFPTLKSVPTKYLAAIAIGLTFWFWTDTIGDATYLDENAAVFPFSAFGGLYHFLVVLAFLLGFAALAIFDHLAVPTPASYEGISDRVNSASTIEVSSNYTTKTLIFVPLAVAAVMGIHSLGEGWNFGAAAAGVGGATDIVSAFGGYSPIVSYPLHKFFEASIIGIIYTVYVGRNQTVNKAKWHLPVLGLLFGLTSAIGASIGYFVSFNTVFFYAFGVTSGIYALIRAAGPLVSRTGMRSEGIIPSFLGGRTFLLIAVGFFLLYSAALLH